MAMLQETYRALRWRLVPTRYAGKVARVLAQPRLSSPSSPKGPVACEVDRTGHAPGPTIAPDALAAMQAIYRPRAAAAKAPTARSHPFVNLFTADDIDAANPLFRFAVSPEVLDVARDYFGERLRYDSIQVLHSFPNDDEGLRESQMWHKDFGDARSFHCIAYLNDVIDDDHGPFGFVDKADTRRIGASPFIRRIGDDRFREELGDGTVRTFCGPAGTSVFVDPAVCYHYGSRCRVARTAIFVTFNTDRPFVPAVPLLRENAARAAAEAAKVRPDIAEAAFRRMFAA